MTLGCGSWGGNVTSDNISPRHLLDIKRIAFETRAINQLPAEERAASQPMSVDRDAIAALVDRFLAERHIRPAQQPSSPLPPPPPPAPPISQPQAQTINGEAATGREGGSVSAPAAPPSTPPTAISNGHVYDFVCEEDVRRAIAAKEKIRVNSKTIITPAARDLGEEREVFTRI
jgi:acetaldehyde dehydrogenase (acetylating)